MPDNERYWSEVLAWMDERIEELNAQEPPEEPYRPTTVVQDREGRL